MAVSTITPLTLVRDVASIDHADADATAVVTGVDGFAIAAAKLGKADKVLIKFVATTACTVRITAGNDPPSVRAGLGYLDVVLATSDVKYIVLEQARFTQSNGTITGVVTTAVNDLKMSVFQLPSNV